MKKYLLIVFLVFILFSNQVYATTSYDKPKKIRCTVYCDSGITKSGVHTRDGIAAMNNAYLGKTALIYRVNKDGSIGELIGIYEVLDTGSNKELKAGKRIDIYCEDLELCNAWIKEYGDYVYLQLIDAVG